MDGHAVVRFSGDVAHSTAFISGLRSAGNRIQQNESCHLLRRAACFILDTGSIGSNIAYRMAPPGLPGFSFDGPLGMQPRAAARDRHELGRRALDRTGVGAR